MSYSFNVRALSKAAARSAVSTKLDEVVANQPIHDHDRASTEKVVDTFLELIGEPAEAHELSVSLHGSCWQRDGHFGGVSVGVDISHQPLFVRD